VALPAGSEVLMRSLHRIAFLIGKSPVLRPIYHNAKNAEEALYPSVAVLEHTNWVVKTAVGLCTDLNGHGVPSIPTIPVIVFYSSAKVVLSALEDVKR
jgi:hypothetical protein